MDSLIVIWDAKLKSVFWAALEREFDTKDLSVRPFNDAKSFVESIHAYVDTAKAHGENTAVFVNDIWKNRIDREWREALMSEDILGRATYTEVDRSVSELNRKTVDRKFIAYSLAIVALIAAGWWYFSRSRKSAEKTT